MRENAKIGSEFNSASSSSAACRGRGGFRFTIFKVFTPSSSLSWEAESPATFGRLRFFAPPLPRFPGWLKEVVLVDGGGDGGIRGDLALGTGRTSASSGDNGRLVEERLVLWDPVSLLAEDAVDNFKFSRPSISSALFFPFCKVEAPDPWTVGRCDWACVVGSDLDVIEASPSPRSFLIPKRLSWGILSSNNMEKDLPLVCFIGDSSTKDVSASTAMSSSSSSCSFVAAFNCMRGKGMMVCEATRLLLSLLGEGETGSPRRRLRARITAFGGPTAVFADTSEDEADEDGFSCDAAGRTASDGRRANGPGEVT